MVTKKNLSLILYVIISFVLVFFMFDLIELSYLDWLQKFSILTIITAIVQIIFLKQEGIRLISFVSFFVSMTYFFHFGQIVLAGLFPKYTFQGFNFIPIVDPEILKQAANFSLISIIVLVFGILLVNMKNKKKYSSNKFEQISVFTTRNIAWILIVLFFPLKLYLDIRGLSNSITGGYLNTFAEIGSGAGIIAVFAYMSFAGFALLMMSYSQTNKKRALLVYIFINIYLVFTMFTGGRGQQIALMLFFLYLEHMFIYRIDIKKMILFGVIGYTLIVFMNAMSDIRGEGIDSYEQVVEVMQESIDNGPIFKLTEEMGGSIYTPYLVVKKTNYSKEFALGSTYINSLCTLVPNVGGLLSKCIEESHFAKSLNRGAIGGSFIAESYFNFKYFGLILVGIIGIVVRKFSNALDKYVEQKKFLEIAIFLPVFTYGLWWVRDAFVGIIRPFIWGLATIIIIMIFVKKFEKEK